VFSWCIPSFDDVPGVHDGFYSSLEVIGYGRVLGLDFVGGQVIEAQFDNIPPGDVVIFSEVIPLYRNFQTDSDLGGHLTSFLLTWYVYVRALI